MAGRDLLHTHFATGRDGARLARSEWAPVITSAPVTRALLLELGQWARTAHARAPGWPYPARRSYAAPKNNAAC